MKKIIALAMSCIFLTATVASAINPTATKTWFQNTTHLTNIPAEVNQQVEADITVKKSASSAFDQGPINVTKTDKQAFPTFDFKATLFMDTVRNLFSDYESKARSVVGTDPDDVAVLESTPVTGEFIVTITYPASLKLPDDAYIYFTDTIDNAFVEVDREVTNLSSSTKALVLTVEVKDGITFKKLSEELQTYLPDLELVCYGAQPTKYGNYMINGSVTGYTVIGEENDPISTVIYNASQRANLNNSSYKNVLAEKITVSKTSTGGSSSGSSNSIPVAPQPGKSIVFDIGGETDLIEAVEGTSETVSVNVDEIKAPEKEGYEFAGWYSDPTFQNEVEGTVKSNEDTVLYAKYVRTEAPEVLAADEHNLYIMGYPDGTVQPTGNITREEVAKALYRLLKKDVRDSITTDTNDFSDVAADRWSNVSISSMAKAGYVNGYEDGTFRPGNKITRAEFATIILRYFEGEKVNNEVYPFLDTIGHWAEKNIAGAYNMYLIQGYEDGTFRPDNYITRAEAMTIINRVTVRHTDAAGVSADARIWPDIKESDWYYYEVMEATNAHSFVRRADKYMEDWSGLLDNEFLKEDK